MATRASIQFDFEQAKRQAAELDNIADNLSSLARDKLGGGLQALSQNWKGVNAASYMSKGSTLQGNMNSSSSQLHAIASDIRTIAQNIYNAEMEAIRIAEERAYREREEARRRQTQNSRTS